MSVAVKSTDMPRMVQAAGGTPVTMMLPEIYEGLSRGVVDTAPFAGDQVVNYRIYEVAKHISEIILWQGQAGAYGFPTPRGKI